MPEENAGMPILDHQDPTIRFGKQFVLGPDSLATEALGKAGLDGWKRHGDVSRSVLYAHPALKVAQAQSSNRRLFLLGEAIDSRAGSDDPVQIAQKLVSGANDFDWLEGELDHLAGRWLLIVEFGEESRIYTDACGLKPAYAAVDKRGQCWVASQPALLASLGIAERDEALVERFESGPRFGGWPVGLIPYPGVNQVLPNHYFDLGTREVVRYWPRRELEPLTIEDAAEQMRASLSSVLGSVVEKRPCITALTGGYDTRLMLACLGSQASSLDFYSIVSEQTPFTMSPSHDG